MKKLILTCVITLLQGFSFQCIEGQTVEDDFGISILNTLISNDQETLCKYITCHENAVPDNCPPDTNYVEGVSQFGCCNACVKFKKINEQHCTGSIDPVYGGGYDSVSAIRTSLTSTPTGGLSLQPNDNVLYSSWCDFYLLCTSMRKCEQDPERKGCIYIQQKYDEAVANPASEPFDEMSDDYIYFRDDYRWRPDCTPTGDYVEKQCKGPIGAQRCVCVDPSGNKIFGQAYKQQTELYEDMNCKCSRRVWELKQAGETTITLHCSENGNYEALQCENGWCYCMDPITAKPYGPNLPETTMKYLPCYNETLVGQQYLRRCESERHAHDILSELLLSKGVQPPNTALRCDEDGSYSPVQTSGSGYRCVDRYNEFLFAPGEGRCECQRDARLFTELGAPQELTCNTNTGRYAEMQVHEGTIYCNDEDGIRAGPLVYLEYEDHLECAAAMQCQNGVDNTCHNACSNCPQEAYVKYLPSDP